VSVIVCVSRELTEQVRSRELVHTAVKRIPYGVPVSPEAVVPKQGVLRLAYVGRLADEQKRVSEVARAFCRVVGEVAGVTAVFYGDGPARKGVEGILAEEGAGSAVRLGGVIPSARIQEVLLECDVVVLLSDYEGLPIALMEAMACGCVPVCLRMRSGIPELVEDGVTGLLVDDRGDSFVAAIQRLRDDPELRTRLARNAKERIQQEYSDTVCNAEWAAMLHELHAGVGNPKPIRIPGRIRLPERNPALESAANRANPPSAVLRFWRRSRILAGKLRRRWLWE
jgi:glycosyltransferase involved in cell wall biosynthesis